MARVDARRRTGAITAGAAFAGIALTLGCGLYARVEPPPVEWRSEALRGHQLVGTIWDTAGGGPIDRATLVARAKAARFVLLGEKHDNPDHHRLQAWVLREICTAGLSPAVLLEMLDERGGEAVRRHRESFPNDAAGLGPAAGWEETGWPSWDLYLPIAEVAVDCRLEMIGAGLSKEEVRSVRSEGLGRLTRALRVRMGLDDPLPPKVERALGQQIREAHCDLLPEELVPPMIRVQRVRDAHMADRLLEADASRGAVLIAGAGHVQRDRGVPFYLERHVPPEDILSIAFIEVRRDLRTPTDLADPPDEPLPFDLIWLTPRLDEDDPCARYRESLEKIGHRERDGTE